MDASWSEREPVNEPWHRWLVEMGPSGLCFLPLGAREAVPPALHRCLVEVEAQGCFRAAFPLHLPYLGAEKFTGEATELDM